ncbi:MAG: succinylglutamate desuccinylase/aspartoacylase family protein [Planctomycetes bacterium]|nr:succinylglutamate desuccinylase/aspartoacylase family protein [Planctomycetota bacterium]
MLPRLPATSILTAFLAALLIAAGAVRPAPAETGALAAGTRWETTYRVIDGPAPGPTILLVGGVHGNEPAGSRAAEQIANWNLERGRLVIVPRANRAGLELACRALPFEPAERGDLGRNFPRSAGDAPRGALAAALWDLALRLRPGWLVDLHEGYHYSRSQPRSVGSSVIFSRTPRARETAARLVEAVNASIDEPEKCFELRSPPIRGSLARAAADRLGCDALILETTTRGQPLSLRTRQHRILVHGLLSELGMVSGGVDRLMSPRRPDEAAAVRVALYDGEGAAAEWVEEAERELGSGEGCIAMRVGPRDILGGALEDFDAVVFGGGRGSRMGRALGDEGRRAVRDFVRRGGGFAGISAGCYLASNGYPWSLGILDARVVDRENWRRGRGRVTIELTGEGRDLLRSPAESMQALYVNGPLLELAGDSGQGGEPSPADDAAPAGCRTLARFRGGIGDNGSFAAEMAGRPALAAGRFGEGRAIGSSVRLAGAGGLDRLLSRVVLWTARKPREKAAILR